MPKNNNLHNFIQPLKEVKLEQDKAQQMRAVLSAYADLHSAPVRTGRYLSPLSLTLSPLSLTPRVWGVLVATLVLLVGGTGISFASENALPGQPLYVVKTKVAEPIQGALALTPKAQAQWHSELADRRLAEASELAAQNQLNATTTAYIQAQVASNVDAANTAAAKLAEAGNTTDALSVRAALSASLAAHADVLALITPRLAAAGDATTTTHVLALLDNVRKAQGSVAADRARTAIAVASGRERPSGKVAVEEATSISNDGASSTETVTIALAVPAMEAHPSRAQSLFRAHIESLLNQLPVATTSTSTASTTATTTEKAAEKHEQELKAQDEQK